jgi:hypothetical protein
MMQAPPIRSVLAEKRTVLQACKKQMIGRRAYTDSLCMRLNKPIKESSDRLVSSIQTCRQALAV